MAQTNMKAVVCKSYGPPEVLEIQEVPLVQIKQNEVLVKIIATTVNSGDIRVRSLGVNGLMRLIMRLIMGWSKPRKSILGTVYSGIITECGSSVSNFTTGNEVFGLTRFRFGCYAEYTAVNALGNICLKPVNATHQEAASVLFGGQSAYYFLKKSGIFQMQNPEVLIYGATGAVGSSAVQIANYCNANVWAVGSSRGKELIQLLHPKHYILYDKEDYTKCHQKFDIIFDAVGHINKKECQHLLKPKAKFLSVKGLDIASESLEQIQFLKKLVENKNFIPVIDRIFPLSDVVEAHRYVETNRKKGSVVLEILDKI
ncbi:MAG: NAD(P)-dependent alcohol dehydrogenase [Flavobacteriaceae bacterium]|nr:NAD(P)-dependent alcohol dehydrogenase [Flavobacteriaceae bacterium]